LDFAFAAIYNEARDMIFKISTGFKKFTVITAILMGFVLMGSRPVCAGAPNDQVPNNGKQNPNAMIVGQSQTPASTPQTNSQASESRDSEPRSQEAQNSEATEKKPLKNFQPTEKIEADQAVDFPYDI
jgi:hypothetical protein